MPTYRYQAYTPAGQIEAGAIDAASARDAVKILNDRGLLPFQTEAAPAMKPHKSWWTLGAGRQLSLADYADIARELSVLLGAGLALDQALRLMTEQAAQAHVKNLLGNLLTSVTSGASLSAAFERYAPSAPAYLPSLIRAGEARGSLAPTLADIASFVKKRADVDAQVRSALTYPLILAATAVGVIIVIIMFLIPALLPMFNETGVEPPWALAMAQKLEGLFATSWPALLALLVLAGPLTIALLRRERARLVMDRMVLRLPLIGDVVTKTNVALLARTLATLLRNGVALVPALSMTAAAMPSRPFAAALRTAADSVREGRRLAATFDAVPWIPKLMVRFTAIGEEASKLDEMLLHLAEMTDTDAQRQVDRLMTMLTPALTIIIGVVIGGIMLSVMQAIMSVNQLALQ